MQIGVQTSSWDTVIQCAELAPELEQAGVDYLWMGEAYTADVLPILGSVAARTTRMRLAPGILNVYSRSAALIAMGMVGLDQVSQGRAACGLGSSGPQVVEGLHGVPFEYPLSRMRTYTTICRQLWSGGRAEVNDRAMRIPLREGTRPMRLTATPTAPIPLWWAALKDASVSAAAECADGWLPFMFFPERSQVALGEALQRGLSRRDPSLGPLQIAADVTIAIGDEYVGTAADDVLAGHRRSLALHIGGMGPRDRNAYNSLAREYGFVDEAVQVQDLYLEGRHEEAARGVPDQLLQGTALVGPEARVKERIDAYRAAGVTMLNVAFTTPDPIAQIAALRRLCDAD